MGPLLARVAAGAAVLVLLLAPSAQAGWRSTQTLEAKKKLSGAVAIATAPSGHAVAVWQTNRGLRVAIARPGRAFGRPRPISGSDTNSGDVRVAVAPNGRAIVAQDYFDNSFFDPTDLRGEGCCHGTKVAIVSARGRVTAARTVRPRGNVSPLAALAAGNSRFGVLVGGSVDGGVRFIAISAQGRPGTPHTVAPARFNGTTLQFSGRRAVAALTADFPARAAVSAERPDGSFSAPRTVLRLDEQGFVSGFIPAIVITAAGRGRNVVAYDSGRAQASRVSVARFDAAGHLARLAGPSAPSTRVSLAPAAIAGNAFAVAWSERTSGRVLRLVTRGASGRVRRITLPPQHGDTGAPGIATGGGAVALSATPGTFSRPLATRVLYIPPGGGRVSRILIPGVSFGAPPVVVDGRGRVRVIWRTDSGFVRTRLRTR
jgi:hypothetical protein